MQITNAVLVTLNISHWEANRQDKRVSEAVAEANEVTERGYCRVRKTLLPKTDVMKRLHAVMRAARNFHYENTHAWMHDGPRMLAVANFDEYMARMREFKADFDAAVMDFLLQYNDIKAEAVTVLGKLYNQDDYPETNWLKSRYSFDMKVQPMPASTELLELGLDADEAHQLRQKLESDMRETFQKANRRMWEDLFERVQKLKNMLQDPKASIKDKTLSDVREMAALLPRLNIMNDERLAAMSERLTTSLAGLSGDSVEHNPETRQRLATETQTVFNVIQSFMSAAKLQEEGQLMAA